MIGHEISHGFDDSGSQFDGDGNLRNWWTKDDREEFREPGRWSHSTAISAAAGIT